MFNHTFNLQHEYQTRATRMQYERYTSDTSETQVLHERHECDTKDKF